MDNKLECEWKCNKCGRRIITAEYDHMRLRCSNCDYWMQWSILDGVKG